MPSPSTSQLGKWHAHPGMDEHTQLFAVGDVHGQAEALAAALDAIARIPRTADRRRIVFLGDLIDRVPQSLGSIQLAMTAAKLALVDDVVILPGNHELMLLDALDDPMRFMGDWLDNGGDTMIAEAKTKGPVRLLNDFAEIARRIVPAGFLSAMRAAPSHIRIGNLLLVHAGLAPDKDAAGFLGLSGHAAQGSHWAWIRKPFLDWRGGWGPDRNWLVVHGHTPAITKSVGPSRFHAAANRVRTGHRICLDAGAACGLPQVGWAEFSSAAFRLGFSIAGRRVSDH